MRLLKKPAPNTIMYHGGLPRGAAGGKFSWGELLSPEGASAEAPPCSWGGPGRLVSAAEAGGKAWLTPGGGPGRAPLGVPQGGGTAAVAVAGLGLAAFAGNFTVTCSRRSPHCSHIFH